MHSWCCNLCAKRGAFWLSFEKTWFWSSFCQIVYCAADADVVLILSLLSRHSHTNLVEPLVTAAITLDPVYLWGRPKKAFNIQTGKSHKNITQLYWQEWCTGLENKTKHFNYARANLVSFWLLASLCRAHRPILLRVVWIRWVRKGVGRGGGSFLLSSPFFVHFGLLFLGLFYLVSVLTFHVLFL